MGKWPGRSGARRGVARREVGHGAGHEGGEGDGQAGADPQRMLQPEEVEGVQPEVHQRRVGGHRRRRERGHDVPQRRLQPGLGRCPGGTAGRTAMAVGRGWWAGFGPQTCRAG